jgi:hypothetical protein
VRVLNLKRIDYTQSVSIIVAGGALIGVTGGLAAPLVGSAIGGFLTTIGVGGTAAGMLATGLATSSVVCGTLFGAYGAKSSATMVERHLREVRDLAIVPVHPPKETLAIRLCVSGWLGDERDVTAPWTVFEGDCDTYALQWVSYSRITAHQPSAPAQLTSQLYRKCRP